LESLIGSIKKIYEAMKNIKVVKLDLNGWGTGFYESVDKEIRYDLVEQLFRTIEEFDNENS
jgi:wyosine [tRNA(Phe)-imidazoG37] synthetase (radical SAM superfamily)